MSSNSAPSPSSSGSEPAPLPHGSDRSPAPPSPGASLSPAGSARFLSPTGPDHSLSAVGSDAAGAPDARATTASAADAASTSGAVLLAEMRSAEIVPAEVEALVRSATAGATVAFTGLVRDHDRDLPDEVVIRLDYSAHPSAATFLAAVCEEVAAKHGVRVAAAHRTGELAVGDVAVVAAVASAHRGEAFAACEELINRIKSEVPIWKRQFGEAGSAEWVRAECAH